MQSMQLQMSRVMRKWDYCLCKNKGADQLRSQPVTAKLISAFVFATWILLKSEISSFLPASVTVQVGLCQTWLETTEDQFSHVVAHIKLAQLSWNDHVIGMPDEQLLKKVSC